MMMTYHWIQLCVIILCQFLLVLSAHLFRSGPDLDPDPDSVRVLLDFVTSSDLAIQHASTSHGIPLQISLSADISKKKKNKKTKSTSTKKKKVSTDPNPTQTVSFSTTASSDSAS